MKALPSGSGAPRWAGGMCSGGDGATARRSAPRAGTWEPKP